MLRGRRKPEQSKCAVKTAFSRGLEHRRQRSGSRGWGSHGGYGSKWTEKRLRSGKKRGAECEVLVFLALVEVLWRMQTWKQVQTRTQRDARGLAQTGSGAILHERRKIANNGSARSARSKSLGESFCVSADDALDGSGNVKSTFAMQSLSINPNSLLHGGGKSQKTSRISRLTHFAQGATPRTIALAII